MKRKIRELKVKVLIMLLCTGLFASCSDNNPTNSSGSENSSRAITAFTVEGQIEEAEITADASFSRVRITVEAGTDLSAVAPTIEISAGASIEPASGEAVDFAANDNSYIYIVTSESGVEQKWHVEIIVEERPIVDGTYMIAPGDNPGKAVSVFGNQTTDGALIHQWDYVPTTAQQWDITKVDETCYKIINVNSGKALEIPGGTAGGTAGTQLQQNPYTGSDRQLWEITHQDTELYQISNKASGYKMTLDEASDEDGVKITQEPANGDGAQLFLMTNLDQYFFNPLLSGGPDPWVIQKDGYYYHLHTTSANITIRKTDSMSDLRDATATVVWTPPSGTEYSHNLWAPELHFLDGNWYVYFAADDTDDANHRMYVIENTSSDPTTGSWTFKGKISDTPDIWAIDGTVLEEGGGRYFLWSGWRTQDPSTETGIQQIYIAEMSDPWTITSSRTLISEPDYDWEKHGLVNEGPQILRNSDGEVFVIYSASGCWTDEYKLGQLKLTGSDPLQASSWTKKSTPVFEKNPDNSVYGPGHASFFKSADGTEDWIIYHAQSESGKGCSGSRSPRMQKVTWTGSGEPDLGVPEKTSTAIPIPSGE